MSACKVSIVWKRSPSHSIARRPAVPSTTKSMLCRPTFHCGWTRKPALLSFSATLRLELRISLGRDSLDLSRYGRRIFRVIDEPPSQVVGLQVLLRIERVYYPHLIAPPAGRNVEPLFGVRIPDHA